MKRVVAIVLLASVGVAQAQTPSEAERLYAEGQSAYDAQRYDDAIAAWQKSYELSHLPALVFNLAQAYRLRGDCAKAVDSYKAFIAADPSSDQRPDAESRLAEIQPCPAVPAKTPAHPKVTTPPPDAGHGKRLAAYALGGGGLVLLAGGAYFGSQASSLASDVKTACTPHCEWTPALAAKESDGNRDATIQYVLLGAGAIAVVTGVILYRSSRHEHASPVTLAPSPGGASLVWLGRF